MVELREATTSDWPKLQAFFHDIYRPHHPLQNLQFWSWQYGNARHGRSFIVVEDGEIKGHLGAYFSDDIAWIMNVYLKESLRGKGFLSKLYSAARSYYPIAATNINAPGLGMYQKMGYIRYHNLLRYVLIRPDINAEEAVSAMQFKAEQQVSSEHWYWKQPGLVSGATNQGDNFVIQDLLGGLRIVDLVNASTLADCAWQSGAKWMDYITTWNDPNVFKLERAGWKLGDAIPYRLDPLIVGSKSDIAFVSEEPMPKSFIVRRYHSDHGRVASIASEQSVST